MRTIFMVLAYPYLFIHLFSFYLLYRRTAAPLRPLIPYNVVLCAIVERLERDEEEKK